MSGIDTSTIDATKPITGSPTTASVRDNFAAIVTQLGVAKTELEDLSGITNAASARTNLGLGTASTQNTGTSGATVPLLSTANTWALSQDFSANGATFPTGTFTPTIVGTTTAGVGTYTVQVGRYQRVGNRIYYTVTLSWTAHTGTGNMRAAGFPFTSSASASMYAAVYPDSITFTGSFLTAVIPASGSQAQIRQMSTAAAATEIAIDTSGSIGITGFYEV